jgi:ATP-dependent helicase HrpA
MLDVGTMKLPLTYHFEPGAEDDGVTVTVPVDALPQLRTEQLEWLIPGLLEDKLIALIRTLPKPIRRGLVPAPETAKQVAANLHYGEGVFLREVAKHFSEIAGDRISPEDFRLEKLPGHLRMRIRVVQPDGEEQAVGRDLSTLLAKLVDHQKGSESRASEVPSEWQRDDIVAWDFADLPRKVRVTRGAFEVVLFPAVVDQVRGVGLRLLDTEHAAERETQAGIRRLYLLANQRELRSQVRWLPRWDEIRIWSSTLCSTSILEDQLQLLLADRAFLKEGIPRTATEFGARQSESGQRIALATQEIADIIPGLMEYYHRARIALESVTGERFSAPKADMEAQLRELLPVDYPTITPWRWLRHLPRYLEAIAYRIEKLTSGGQARDEANQREIQLLSSRYHEGKQRTHPHAESLEALTEYRWMLEEYRVSLFAQPLGTATKVSPQRLRKQWEKVGV